MTFQVVIWIRCRDGLGCGWPRQHEACRFVAVLIATSLVPRYPLSTTSLALPVSLQSLMTRVICALTLFHTNQATSWHCLCLLAGFCICTGAVDARPRSGCAADIGPYCHTLGKPQTSCSIGRNRSSGHPTHRFTFEHPQEDKRRREQRWRSVRTHVEQPRTAFAPGAYRPAGGGGGGGALAGDGGIGSATGQEFTVHVNEM